MSTYLELKKQAEALMAQAEAARQQEISTAIAQIREIMSQFSITLEDLGARNFSSAARGRRTSAVPQPAKYRGPNGETWSGGRGRKPQWVTSHLAAGGNLEDLAI